MRSRLWIEVIVVAACLLIWQSPAVADQTELFAGAWKYDITGTFATGADALDVNELNVRSEGQLSLVFAYQTEGNWLPDFGASYDHVGASSKVVARNSLQFGSLDLIGGQTTIATRTHFDAYSISIEAPFYLFNVRTGVGITVTRLIGSIKLDSADQLVALSGVSVPLPGLAPIPGVREDVNELVPAPHFRFEGDFTSWLGFTVNADYIAYGGEHLGDLRAVLNLKPFKWAALTAGYQGKLYKFNEDGFQLNVRLDGVIFGMTAIIP